MGLCNFFCVICSGEKRYDKMKKRKKEEEEERLYKFSFFFFKQAKKKRIYNKKERNYGMLRLGYIQKIK